MSGSPQTTLPPPGGGVPFLPSEALNPVSIPTEAGPPPQRSRARKLSSTALKVALTAILCSLIVQGVDWSSFWTSVRGVEPALLLLVVALHAAGLSLSSEKWGQLLKIHGARVGTGLLIRWYCVAGFANHFLPSSIGGDAYRIMKTRRHAGSAPRAALAILEERISGLVGLLFVGYVLALAGYGTPRAHLLDAVAVAGTSALVAAATLALGLLALSRQGRLTVPRKLGRVVNPLVRNAKDFRRHRRRSALVGLISVVFHLNKVLAIWLILLALDQPASFPQVAVGILVVEVVGILPLSLGGLGLMEGSFMVVMAEFGLDPAVALAAMLLLRVSLLPIAGVGAVIYLSGDRTGATRQQR